MHTSDEWMRIPDLRILQLYFRDTTEWHGEITFSVGEKFYITTNRNKTLIEPQLWSIMLLIYQVYRAI